ncbi:hypothetical protein Lser_V15G11406 [Lactuca serriola]
MMKLQISPVIVLRLIIERNVRSGPLRNIDSARISIPRTVKYDDSQQCYRHKARLEETKQYWRGWYEGLSENFLSSPVPKLLLLARTDRLDRSLLEMRGDAWIWEWISSYSKD